MTPEEWLGKENKLGISILCNKYMLTKEDGTKESLDEWFNRVSGNNEKIKEILINKEAMFGGRILANRGKKIKPGSTANCYSRGFVEDSLEDIMQVNTDLALTFRKEGGQGVSLSKIRPKGSLIHGEFESDGIIPFMKIFDVTTKGIMQGNHRRGALLMSLDVWHKEALNFIKIKSDLKEINNANLSLEVDDEFMECVNKYYTTGENTIKHIKRKYGNDYIEYDVNVIELYKEICKHACMFAEPGILFIDPYRNYIMQEFNPDYKIETGNACSEQSLPKHGACNLCSINLTAFVSNPYTVDACINYNRLREVAKLMTIAMDDIIDENMPNHPLKEQAGVSMKFRNIGIGFMGLHDALLMLGIKYGSKESTLITHEFMHTMLESTLETSIELGKIRGNFPAYNPCVWDSNFIKSNFTEDKIAEFKKINCLRNAELMSIAPTGSIGTMLNVSTGLEPNFRLSYTRRSPNLGKNGEDAYFKVDIQPVIDYKMINNTQDLPDYFIDSSQIPWKERIEVQAAAQVSCDTACSSTCNLPKGTTPEEIEQVYLEAWKNRLKGFTIFVDGSRDPILFDENSKTTETITVHSAPKRPKELNADFHMLKIKGEQFIVLIGLLNNRPYEIFAYKPNIDIAIKPHIGKIIKKSKMHYSFESDIINISSLESINENIEEKATTLYASMLLRHGVDIKYIIKTAKKVNDNISSFTSAICRILSKYIPAEVTGEKCPECGGNIIKEGGCEHCESCGYSRCG